MHDIYDTHDIYDAQQSTENNLFEQAAHMKKKRTETKITKTKHRTTFDGISRRPTTNACAIIYANSKSPLQ